MSEYRDDLRAYIFKVARGLVARGAIRRAQGQTVGDLIAAEAAAVGKEVIDDLLSVATELKMYASIAGAQVARVGVHQAVDRGMGMLFEALLGGPKRPGR